MSHSEGEAEFKGFRQRGIYLAEQGIYIDEPDIESLSYGIEESSFHKMGDM